MPRTKKAAVVEPVVIEAPAFHRPPSADELAPFEVVQVDRTAREIPIHSYDESGLIELGTVRKYAYDGGSDVQRMTFASGETGKEYSLGVVGRSFDVISHAEILYPFLEQGFEVRSAMYGKGGAKLTALLAHPDFRLDDAIGWDVDWLNQRGVDGSRAMELSVRIKSDLTAYRGISATAGWFRMICTNGLVAQVLGMGTLMVPHRTWGEGKVEAFAQNLPTSIDQMPSAPTELLDDVLDILDRIDAEAASLPRLIREPAAKLAGALGKAKREPFRENLLALRAGTEQFSMLDIVNAQTNLAHTGGPASAIYGTTDLVAHAMSDLIEVAAVKRDMVGFA